jgi:hypothetical protein
MERKPLPKSIRFEVLKRDCFTCQYCGREAPDVILEVDHIIPISKGGDDSLMNLVTACRDCNRGKSNKKLSDMAAAKAQKKQADDLQARREQLELMVQWKQELMMEKEKQIETVESLIACVTGFTLTDHGKATIRKHIRRFGFSEVYSATEISLDTYWNGQESSWDNMFYKIGGICYNRKKAREQDAEQDS